MIELPLQSSVNKGFIVLLDDEDFELVRDFVWRPLIIKTAATTYAIRYFGAAGSELMHRRILGLTKGDGWTVDHIDHNGLNNQRGNMRKCLQGENSRNRKMSSHNTTGFKGVQRDSQRPGRFRAVVTHGGNRHLLRWVKDPQKAHEMYLEKSRELHGEFAYE